MRGIATSSRWWNDLRHIATAQPARTTPAGWPSNWESLVWQLARFFHCGPEPFWRMTGLDLLEGCNAANAMIEAEAKRRSHAR